MPAISGFWATSRNIDSGKDNLMEKTISEKREQWLDIAKTLTLKAAERHRIFQQDLCPSGFQQSEPERKASLKQVAELAKEISTLSSRLAIIERDGSIGAKGLGIDDEIARTTLALLVIARLSGDAGRDVKRVSDVIDLVGGRDPARCVAVRCLFRENNGSLFPHVWIGRSPVLDEATIYLTENAFNRICGLESESQKMCDAVGLLGRWERQ